MSDSLNKFSEEIMGMPAPQVSNSSLHTMAQSAVDLAEREHIPLVDAITKTASANSSLSTEHLRRVTEMANTTAHLRHLNEGDNYPVFDLADYRDVWKNLDKTASARSTMRSATSASLDFGMAPKRKTASLQLPVKEELVTKEAAVTGLLNTAHTLKEAHAQTQEQADYYEYQADQSRIKLASEIRTHLLNEGSMADVAALAMQGGKWEKLAFAGAVQLLEESEKTARLRELLAPVAHLTDDALILGLQQHSKHKRKADSEHNVKVSSIRAPNPEHPLTVALSASAQMEKKATVYRLAANRLSTAQRQGDQLLAQARSL